LYNGERIDDSGDDDNFPLPSQLPPKQREDFATYWETY